jgi:hypothetical protein
MARSALVWGVTISDFTGAHRCRNRQRTRKHHFQPRVIFGYIDRAVGGLAKRPNAELQAVVGPGFLLDGKDLSELRPRRL